MFTTYTVPKAEKIKHILIVYGSYTEHDHKEANVKTYLRIS
jgi:hypothetical protein